MGGVALHDEVSRDNSLSRPLAVIPAVAIARPVLDLLGGPRRAARVHSAFSRAVTLELGQRLVALTCPAAPIVPNGISLACPEGRPTLLGLRRGQQARIGGGEIVFPQSGVRIAAAEAEEWEPSLSFHVGKVEAATLAAGVRHLAAILIGREGEHHVPDWLRLLCVPEPPAVNGASRVGLDLAFCAGRLAAAIDELAASLARGDQAASLVSTRRLAGLGPGLTPAGDDILVGVCAALGLVACTAPLRPQSARALSRLRRLIAETAASQTTALSATWLRHAGEGEFARPVLALAQALAADRQRAIKEATAALAELGASSGRCTLIGLLAAGRALTAGYTPVW